MGRGKGANTAGSCRESADTTHTGAGGSRETTSPLRTLARSTVRATTAVGNRWGVMGTLMRSLSRAPPPGAVGMHGAREGYMRVGEQTPLHVTGKCTTSTQKPSTCVASPSSQMWAMSLADVVELLRRP